jgi:hypothetical protein
MFRSPIAPPHRPVPQTQCRTCRTAQAFTRIELTAVIAAGALLLAMVLPALAEDRIRANRAVCMNNLSRIGQALAGWSGDYEERYSWEVDQSLGGTRAYPSSQRAWNHFAVLSNQLPHPRVLVCPSDGARSIANSFADLRLSQNSSISYLLGHPTIAEGRSILSGDRNITNTSQWVSCFEFGAARFLSRPATNASWGPTIHAHRGHLLFNDGTVEGTDDRRLRNVLSTSGITNAFHYETPDS